MPAENVWSPFSKSAHSQVFTALFYVQTTMFAGHGSVQTMCVVMDLRSECIMMSA